MTLFLQSDIGFKEIVKFSNFSTIYYRFVSIKSIQYRRIYWVFLFK